MSQKVLKKTCWENFKFYPTDKFKIYWDMVIILLSIWNSILIPYELAFPSIVEEEPSLTTLDYFIDAAFAFDIVINFRSVYYDPKTETQVTDGKKIAWRYVQGRFWIDLLASLPLEMISLLFVGVFSSSTLKLFGMFKLVRLLRLGRMITYMKVNRSFKFSMKLIQLLFLLLLMLHWIACFWYMTTGGEIRDLANKSWFPPKDLDLNRTLLFRTTNRAVEYFLLFYYAVLTLVGNEMMPTTIQEVGIAALIVFIGSIVIGTIIGEFSNILSEMTKKARQQNEELHLIGSVMTTLKIPEETQNRIYEYFDIKNEGKYVKNEKFYEILN